MTTITPAERAAFRAAYFHSLAMALIESDTLRWYSAGAEERAEVRSTVAVWHKVPDEVALELREKQRRELRIKADAKAARAAKALTPRKKKAKETGKDGSD
jgi:hypothetical protein